MIPNLTMNIINMFSVKLEHLAMFRMLEVDGSEITRNWRPVQDIGTGDRKRVVFSMDKSWKD